MALSKKDKKKTADSSEELKAPTTQTTPNHEAEGSDESEERESAKVLGKDLRPHWLEIVAEATANPDLTDDRKVRIGRTLKHMLAVHVGGNRLEVHREEARELPDGRMFYPVTHVKLFPPRSLRQPTPTKDGGSFWKPPVLWGWKDEEREKGLCFVTMDIDNVMVICGIAPNGSILKDRIYILELMLALVESQSQGRVQTGMSMPFFTPGRQETILEIIQKRGTTTEAEAYADADSESQKAKEEKVDVTIDHAVAMKFRKDTMAMPVTKNATEVVIVGTRAFTSAIVAGKLHEAQLPDKTFFVVKGTNLVFAFIGGQIKSTPGIWNRSGK